MSTPFVLTNTMPRHTRDDCYAGVLAPAQEIRRRGRGKARGAREDRQGEAQSITMGGSASGWRGGEKQEGEQEGEGREGKGERRKRRGKERKRERNGMERGGRANGKGEAEK